MFVSCVVQFNQYLTFISFWYINLSISVKMILCWIDAKTKSCHRIPFWHFNFWLLFFSPKAICNFVAKLVHIPNSTHIFLSFFVHIRCQIFFCCSLPYVLVQKATAKFIRIEIKQVRFNFDEKKKSTEKFIWKVLWVENEFALLSHHSAENMIKLLALCAIANATHQPFKLSNLYLSFAHYIICISLYYEHFTQKSLVFYVVVYFLNILNVVVSLWLLHSFVQLPK